MHNGGVVPGDSSAGDVPVLLQPGETVVPVSGRRLPPGYAPGPEKVTNDFGTKAVGGHMSGVIGDLSFPRTAGMMPRGGPVCKTCYLPPSDHVTPAAQAGYSPLQSVPGIHPDVDDPTETRNSADVLAESRNAAFYGSAG
jgi:hypothetical protein